MVGQYHACMAFFDTIKVEGKKVKWECNTIGHHEKDFDTVEEAEKWAEKLRAVSLSFNCGNLVIDMNAKIEA